MIGTAKPNGRAVTTTVVRNSELYGSLPGLHTSYEGTYRRPKPLIPNRKKKGNGWQVAATYVENGRQLIFINEFSPVTGSTFDRFTGHSGIAALSVPTGGRPTLR
jgi:hypothetical protein